MAFGNMMNKAKETVKKSTEEVSKLKMEDFSGVVLDNLKNQLEEFNNVLPILKEYGYNLKEMEVILGVPPKFKFHFHESRELSEDEENKIIKELKNDKVASLIVKSLIQAKKIKNIVKIGKLKFNEIEIEAGIPPVVIVKFN